MDIDDCIDECVVHVYYILDAGKEHKHDFTVQ